MTFTLNHLVNKHWIDVVMQWIPCYSRIKGNERADTIAKQGANLPQPDVPVPYDTAVQIIKLNMNG